MKEPKAIVEDVRSDGIGAELGITKGDQVVSINGQAPRDFIDYRFMCAEEDLELEVMKENGDMWVCDIQKDIDEDLGIRFTQDTFDGMKNCANKCIFCFVDQMPADMRESLYMKDDDYRLSFLHGNFVTLTNVTKQDLDRIVRMRISPLYISVHCTSPKLRELMLGSKKAGKITDQLRVLARAGIEMHTQIVLCPGINDGEELAKSIQDLAALHPQVISVAVVPVGLTRHRENLHSLRKISPAEAGELIDLIHRFQQEFIEKYDSPLVYPADEFYVLAGRDFPSDEMYGGYPQLENGVGLVRLFYESMKAAADKLPKALPVSKKCVLVTGASGEYVLKSVTQWLNQIENLEIEVVRVVNRFFGEHVTVAGLLTGGDVLAALKEIQVKKPFDLALLPSVMCRRDELVFLDGLTPGDLEHELGVGVRVVDIDEGAEALIKAIME